MAGNIGRTVVLALIGVATVLAGVLLAQNYLDTRRAPPIVITDVAQERPIVVAIAGAVARPGTYEFPAGARLGNLVDAAGGYAQDADPIGLNPARLLVDGEQVIVPLVVTKPTTAAIPVEGAGVAAAADAAATTGLETATVAPTPATSAPADPVDINTAGIDELDALPGIGPVLAERIVAYREEHGPFTSVDELEAVQGISAAMVDELRPLITAGLAGR